MRSVTMAQFRRPPSDVERMTSLRVDNLPYRASGDDLQPLFEKYGDVGDIYLPLERDSGRSRGFAFVRYYDKRDAEDALDALNGRMYDGRDLRISMDAGRPRFSGDRGGRGGGGGRYDDRRGGGRDDDRRGGGGGGYRRDRSDSRDRDRGRRSRSRSNDRGRGGRGRSEEPETRPKPNVAGSRSRSRSR